MRRDRLLGVLALVLVALVPSVTRGQPRHVLAFTPPACGPEWWDAGAFASALSVELVTLEARLSDAYACGTLSVVLECLEAGAHAQLVVAHEGASVERAVELDDVAPSMRIRALALAAHDAIAETLSTAPRLLAPATLDPTSEPEPAVPSASPPTRRADTLSPPGAAPAHDVIEPRPPPRPFTTSLRARGTLLEGPTLALGPSLELEIVIPGLPLAFLAGAEGAYGVASHELGEGRAMWADLSVGLRAFVDESILRAGLSVSLAAGYLRIDGVGADEGVSVDSLDAPGAALDVALSASLAATDVLRVSLVVGARVWIASLEARAAGRPLVAMAGVSPFVEIGIGITP